MTNMPTTTFLIYCGAIIATFGGLVYGMLLASGDLKPWTTWRELGWLGWTSAVAIFAGFILTIGGMATAIFA